MHSKGANRMANCVDPDEIAPLEVPVVRSGSTLFAQTCLYECLGSVWYYKVFISKHLLTVFDLISAHCA